MSEQNATNSVMTNEGGMFARFTIRGTVVRKIRTKSALIFAVASSNPTAGKSDFPRFVVLENLNETDKLFSLGDRVTIVAHMRTSKKYPNGTLVPETITVEKNKMDAAFAGEEFLLDKNEAVIRGELVGVPYTPNDTTTLMTIRVNLPDGSMAYLKTIAFGRIAQSVRRKSAGDMIDAVGYIRTKSTKETQDVNKNQSIVIISAR